MTVDRELVAARIAKIREHLRQLARMETLSREAFVASTIEQHAVERELQVVIEACLDIGHHVIARAGLRRPTDYRDVFTVLRESGILETALGQRLERMASFRNRLVHGYLDVTPDRVYDVARHELGDVDAFVAAIVTRYLPTADSDAPTDQTEVQ
jgi:uncharacterized protein YutE (UPF0331/DUF86 family)